MHLALQTIAGALVERGCPSLLDESAISTLRELGGFTAIVRRSLEGALQPYEENPRAASALDGIRHRLVGRVPELRSRVQRFLSRIHPEPRAARPGDPNTHPKVERRHPLPLGSHSEVKLRVPELGWHGIADLVSISTTSCEIRDFKTGTLRQEHEFQLRTYALLWARDNDLNPSGRRAHKLVLSYEQGDIDVPAPSLQELRVLEDELRERTASALTALHIDPPKARPSPENCQYCSVRQLCDDYWQWHTRQDNDRESFSGQFADLQIKLIDRHGPRSWDAMVESSSELQACGKILLRTTNLQFDFCPGQRLRLLNVHITVPIEEAMDDNPSSVVATMGVISEVFLLSA